MRLLALARQTKKIWSELQEYSPAESETWLLRCAVSTYAITNVIIHNNLTK